MTAALQYYGDRDMLDAKPLPLRLEKDKTASERAVVDSTLSFPGKVKLSSIALIARDFWSVWALASSLTTKSTITTTTTTTIATSLVWPSRSRSLWITLDVASLSQTRVTIASL